MIKADGNAQKMGTKIGSPPLPPEALLRAFCSSDTRHYS